MISQLHGLGQGYGGIRAFLSRDTITVSGRSVSVQRRIVLHLSSLLSLPSVVAWQARPARRERRRGVGRPSVVRGGSGGGADNVSDRPVRRDPISVRGRHRDVRCNAQHGSAAGPRWEEGG